MTSYEDRGKLLSRSDKWRITRLRGQAVSWYQVNGRSFPWRAASATTFEKICVEVLLQRTRAETVADAYPQFFAKFRDWTDLDAASIEELEIQFKPIGLWRRRARSIKGLARYASERNGRFPSAVPELVDVPGVGQYLANAILLFQHGQPRPLLDVNMARVLERFIRPRQRADIRFDPWLQAASQWLVRAAEPEQVNWAILDLASAICASRRPRCDTCPVASSCNKSMAY